MKLNISVMVLVALFTVAIVGCTGGAERKAHRAEAAYNKEKTQTLKDYKKCVKKASGNEKKQQECEGLLKALSASEGGTVGDKK